MINDVTRLVALWLWAVGAVVAALCVVLLALRR